MNYFSPDEFKCKCKKCGNVGFVISHRLIEKLNAAREIYGKPMVINSGYRCKEWNELVGGVSSSAHLRGEAADIACSYSRDRFFMKKALYAAGFNRIGTSQGFIHVDVSLVDPQDVEWLYGQED